VTVVCSVDPGLNTGVVLGYYDPITPLQITARWQVHRGLAGFLDWIESGELRAGDVDEWIVERFIFDPGAQAVDLAGVPIEGVVAYLAGISGAPVIWHTRADKSGLVGYPESAKTKKQRQRVRFDFLQSCGMFAAGTENDDTNDAAAHALVSLKRRRHMPTLRAYFGKGNQ
jgi:hypothetical protein